MFQRALGQSQPEEHQNVYPWILSADVSALQRIGGVLSFGLVSLGLVAGGVCHVRCVMRAIEPEVVDAVREVVKDRMPVRGVRRMSPRNLPTRNGKTPPVQGK